MNNCLYNQNKNQNQLQSWLLPDLSGAKSLHFYGTENLILLSIGTGHTEKNYAFCPRLILYSAETAQHPL